MTYESREDNAMILPIPVKHASEGDAVRFIDLENYPDFFEDLSRCFPYSQPSSIGCSASKVASDALEVFEVGNYIASFVPSLADFDRLDPRFALPRETWNQIPGYKEFGFAVFQLAAGFLKPHPMAFEFQALSAELFFPTVHIHDGEVHDDEEFDHILYMQHAGLDSIVYGYQNAYVEDKSTGLVRSKTLASAFCDIDRTKGLLDGNLLLHRKIVRGRLPNCDTVISPSGDPVSPTFNPRPLSLYAPWLIMILAVGWFLNRRSKIQRVLELKKSENDDVVTQTWQEKTHSLFQNLASGCGLLIFALVAFSIVSLICKFLFSIVLDH